LKLGNILVTGASGFIGSHLVKKLKEDGFLVNGVDLKYPEYWKTYADNFIVGDLRELDVVTNVIDRKYDEIYQLAADMGGAGYINSGNNDAEVMSNSILINVNVLKQAKEIGIKSIFFSSSACVYPEYNQTSPDNPNCKESSTYPAAPDTEYGWEKLFSERLYFAYNKNYGMNNKVARYHNVYGPYGTWNGGKEKAPAAICRKVIKSQDSIEIWGDGKQTRSFLYIDECIKATRMLMDSDFNGPVNIGSEEMVSINELVNIACLVEGKVLDKVYIPGPLGVRGRNSNNDLIKEKLGWSPSVNLKDGIEKTYFWIKDQIDQSPNIN
jgi:nucleoside-diphosphate-sugar epimerase